MFLENSYSIEKSGAGFKVVHIEGERTDKKTGEILPVYKEKYYGSVKQALIGYLHWKIDNTEVMTDISNTVITTLRKIDEAESGLKRF